jgi:hypothetical protein
MTLPIFLNVTAVMASLLALAVSSTFAIRQIRLARQAHQVPAMDFLWIMRSPKFLRSEEDLWAELPKQDLSLPFSDLPEALRDEAESILSFYQKVAYLVGLGIVDVRLAILPVHYRAPRTWAAVEPFVRNERIRRGDELAFYNAFEHLVGTIERADIVRMSNSIFPPHPPPRHSSANRAADAANRAPDAVNRAADAANRAADAARTGTVDTSEATRRS